MEERVQSAHPVPDDAPGVPELTSDWIDDDGLLRDEGVIVGRALGTDVLPANADVVRWKLEAIRAYYDERRAPLREHLKAAQRQLQQLLERETALQEELASHERALAALAEAEPRLPLTGRNLILALLMATLCALIPFVLAELLPSDRFEHPLIVAFALGLLGLFTVFQGRSLLVAADARLTGSPTRPEPWKLYTMEMLPPIAIALFVATFSYQPEIGLLAVLATALTVWLLLLVPGRLLMSLLTRTLPELSSWWRLLGHHRRLRRQHRMAIAAVQQQLRAIAQQREQLASETIPLIERRLAFLEARCRRKEALFLSELELARQRNLLRDRQPTNGQHTPEEVSVEPDTR